MSSLAPAGIAAADTFTATYRELARSPASHATSWYSGAVTKDGKFIYGMGHSHPSYGNSGLWTYDAKTDTHTSVFPDVGRFWRWDKGADGHVIAQTGRWAPLDPAADKALVEFFGGTVITAMTNRNNHQAFYMPGVDQFWVMAGTTFSQTSPYMYGRFDLKTNRWVYVSKPWGAAGKNDLVDFSAGMIAGTPFGWVAPNAATAVCEVLDTAVLFGGMGDKTGTVRLIERNTAGPEQYRWANGGQAPIALSAENVRHNAACVDDTVYFVTGQVKASGKAIATPNPGPFWKFHVPTRTWTRLPDGPAGSYFTVMTYDAAANALLVYGGTGGPNPGNRLWVYDLAAGRWHDLTGTVANLPRVSMHTGGYIPGFGHVYKGGKRFDATGRNMGYTASAQMMVVKLERSGAARAGGEAAQQARTGALPAARQSIARRVRDRERSNPASAARTGGIAEATSAAPETQPPRAGMRMTWTRIPLPGQPNSPQGSMKHQRPTEGPGGRVYILGGDWGGGSLGGMNTGRQEVHSFDPNDATGDWRLEAPICGTVEHPVHWHTDEAGTAWDAKRSVFWKLAGTEYGEDDACLAQGRSVKAKVITFNPATRAWEVPNGFDQTRFGYVTNGVLDVARDEIIQIVDSRAFHLNLGTGKWTSYPLPGDQHRFNARTALIGRAVWWLNRREQLEAYNLDTHDTAQHGPWPWPPIEGYATQMMFNLRGKALLVSPTSGPREPRRAALYDPARRQWTVIDQGEGWGNSGVMLSDGRLVLMGGGISGQQAHNRQVWIGTVTQ